MQIPTYNIRKEDLDNWLTNRFNKVISTEVSSPRVRQTLSGWLTSAGQIVHGFYVFETPETLSDVSGNFAA